MISSSGMDAVSAVSMVDSLNLFLVNVFVALSVGGTVVVAQYRGSGNDQMVPRAAVNSVTAAFTVSFAVALTIIILHNPILQFLFGNADPAVLDNARIYLIGSCISYCGFAVEDSICGALKGVGQTKTSLSLSFIMNLSYVLFNVLFINILDMGVLGMVISLITARYLGAACAIYCFFKLDTPIRITREHFSFIRPDMLKRILYIGVPFASEQLFFNGGKILTQTFIVSMGTYAIATNAISSSYNSLMFIVGNTVSVSIITVVGQCMGRKNVADAKKLVRSFVALASAGLVLMGFIILPLFNPLMSLFNPPVEILSDLFRIAVVNWIAQFIFWPISFIIPSALRSAGDSKFTSIVAMLSMWLFRVVLGYLLGIVFNMGIVGVWMAMNIEWGVRGLVFLLRFRGTKWYAHRLID